MSVVDQLPTGHVLRTLYREHEVILRLLSELSALEQRVTVAAELHPDDEPELRRLAQSLLDAEPHHAREEQVLFPELEACGIGGPPTVMRMEHESLRELKHELQQIATRTQEIPFIDLQQQLAATSQRLVEQLRSHIHKEDEILYPMALQQLEPSRWSEMKTKAEAIGPCSFTPEE